MVDNIKGTDCFQSGLGSTETDYRREWGDISHITRLWRGTLRDHDIDGGKVASVDVLGHQSPWHFVGGAAPEINTPSNT